VSFTNRLKKANKAYKKASGDRFPKLPDGEHQLEIVSAITEEPESGYFEGCILVKLKFKAVAGPDKGMSGPSKTYCLLNAEDQPDEKGMNWFKADLTTMGVDADFDLVDLPKILKELVGIVVEGNVQTNPNNTRWQNLFINGVTDALDDDDEEEEEIEEEEEEEKKPAKKAAKKASKKKKSAKKSTKKKAASKAKAKPEPEPEEEEEEWEDDLEESTDDESWEEDDEDDDEDWED
jgi:cell division septation protein DedD